MAKIGGKPSKYMFNLTHVLPTYIDEEKTIVNALIEINSTTINKYERIFESGQLKLDRVGYSSLAYPFEYGEIPQTMDLDNDPLDIMIVNVTEPLFPGSVAEARIIGVMKFEDSEEVDDKVIAVLSDDKRSDHINSIEQLGEHWKKEVEYYWAHYKDLKKPGTCVPKGFFDASEAVKIIDEAAERYKKDIAPQVQ